MSNKSEVDNSVLARAIAREGSRASVDAHRSRTEFLARVSHEFRTPLNAVIGLTRVLETNRDGNQRPQDLQLLSRVRAGGEQLLRLVETVIDQPNEDVAMSAPKIEDTDVLAAISRVAEIYRQRAAAKGLRLLVLLPEYAVRIGLDRAHFEIALAQLLDIATRFTASGVIKLKLATDVVTGRPMRVTVNNTGVGIPGGGFALRQASQLCSGMGCALTAKTEDDRIKSFTITFPAE